MELGTSRWASWKFYDESSGNAAPSGIQGILGQDASCLRVFRAAPSLLEPRLAAQPAQHSSL